jgi:hypothetical protein
MSETTCRWDQEAKEYLTPDGETCETAKREHCTARKTCSQHLAWGELTCARCRLRTRNDLRQIVERAALMLPEAMASGVESEAAMLAGPAADYRVFSARRNIDKRWIMDHIPERQMVRAMKNLLEDDDELHPYSVTTRWAMMLAEDYGLELPAVLTVSNACQFLERLLSRVSNDEEQDYRLMAVELRRCRTNLEAAMRDSQTPERGVPCPTCVDSGKVDPARVRLVREYPHWCDLADCHQFHIPTNEADLWVCPRDRAHWWSHADYTNRLEERKVAG